jgi:hypothetical protein
MLAVGYSQNGVGSLIIIDTFSKYHMPIDIRKEWGIVTAIAVEPKRGRLIFGTRGGVSVLCDIRANYKIIGIYSHGEPVTSISLLGEYVVISAACTIVRYNIAEPTVTDTVQTDFRIACVRIVTGKLVAAGEPNHLVVWNARRSPPARGSLLFSIKLRSQKGVRSGDSRGGRPLNREAVALL